MRPLTSVLTGSTCTAKCQPRRKNYGNVRSGKRGSFLPVCLHSLRIRILVVTDWVNGLGLGRPLCIHDQEYVFPLSFSLLFAHTFISIDVHLPTECDDEYWISPDGQPLFEQPPDKPSKVSAFNCLIRLTQVLALVHRTLVSTCASVYLRSLTFIYFILYSIRPSLPKTQLKATGRRGS